MVLEELVVVRWVNKLIATRGVQCTQCVLKTTVLDRLTYTSYIFSGK